MSPPSALPCCLCALSEDGRFEGAVAIKLLHLSLLGRAGAERFRREGHILARLKHPHIASLLDAGVTPGGQPYLVLELVQGEHIDRHCDALSLDIEARLALFDDVLAAVAHAHTHGVIHRDLKPGNILVTHEGQVKLLDCCTSCCAASTPRRRMPPRRLK
jgi:serine/threonine-protein kinase